MSSATSTSITRRLWTNLTVRRLALVVVIVLLWESLVISLASLNLFVFPSIVSIAEAIVWLLGRGEFYYHYSTTAQEVAIAFGLAAVVGVIGGVALSTNEVVAEGVELFIYYTQAVPKILLYPIMLLWLGVGLESKVMMGFLAAILPIIINTLVGALGVREEYLKVARANVATRRQLLTKVYIPSIVPHLINGFRIGAGVAIIGVTIAENYASHAGLGLRLHFYYSNLQFDRMYGVLIILFASALIVNLGLLELQERLSEKGYGTGEDTETEFTY